MSLTSGHNPKTTNVGLYHDNHKYGLWSLISGNSPKTINVGLYYDNKNQVVRFLDTYSCPRVFTGQFLKAVRVVLIYLIWRTSNHTTEAKNLKERISMTILIMGFAEWWKILFERGGIVFIIIFFYLPLNCFVFNMTPRHKLKRTESSVLFYMSQIGFCTWGVWLLASVFSGVCVAQSILSLFILSLSLSLSECA